MALKRPEEEVQKAGLELLALIYPESIPFHVPNQRFGKLLRIILSKLGVVGGIPDLPVIRPYGRMGWIEFKDPNKVQKKTGRPKLNENQEKLFPRMGKMGHPVYVVWDVTQIPPIVNQWKKEDKENEPTKS